MKAYYFCIVLVLGTVAAKDDAKDAAAKSTVGKSGLDSTASASGHQEVYSAPGGAYGASATGYGVPAGQYGAPLAAAAAVATQTHQGYSQQGGYTQGGYQGQAQGGYQAAASGYEQQQAQAWPGVSSNMMEMMGLVVLPVIVIPALIYIILYLWQWFTGRYGSHYPQGQEFLSLGPFGLGQLHKRTGGSRPYYDGAYDAAKRTDDLIARVLPHI